MRSSLYRTRYRHESRKSPEAYIRILNVVGAGETPVPPPEGRRRSLGRRPEVPHLLYVQDKAIPIPSVSQVVGDYVAVPSGRKILKLGLS
jgi:hypothetical protein